MESLPPCYGIIPSRYASHRFPGKPLADILGQPMFWHVFQRAIACPLLKAVAVATDDQRIYTAAENRAVPVVMTKSEHPSGTDRVLEAARLIGVPQEAVVVNIQGDEPALNPNMLTELLKPFTDPAVQVTTLATEADADEEQNPDRVKVVFAEDGRALYFSRAAIPHRRHGDGKPFFVHIGIYAFRMHILERFASLSPSSLEITEKLEQLRLLEHNIPIHVVKTSYQSAGVDRPEDIPVVCELVKRTATN